MTLASSSPKRDGAAVLPADGGSEPGSFESTTPCRSAGRVGGGASIVLEDLGADAPATVTRCEFGVCAGHWHGVRSPTSSKVQGGSKSRSWQGRSSASQPLRCGRLLGVLGHEGAVAALAIEHFENSTAGGNPNNYF